MDLKELRGKRALITGGSKGIGLAIKKALEAEGVKCISISRTEGYDLECDSGVFYVFKEIDFGKIDILINNLGGGGTWKPNEAHNVMEKNYGRTQLFTRKFLETKRKWGRVITIGSTYGTDVGLNPEFTAAKAAQIMFMKSMAFTNDSSITFNTVSPTEVADAGTKKPVDLKSKDVANLVTFLCSDKAKYINGQNIVIGEYP